MKLLFAIASLVFIIACGGGTSAENTENTPVITPTVFPTFTPIPTPVPTPTPTIIVITAVPVPTPIPAPTPVVTPTEIPATPTPTIIEIVVTATPTPLPTLTPTPTPSPTPTPVPTSTPTPTATPLPPIENKFSGSGVRVFSNLTFDPLRVLEVEIITSGSRGVVVDLISPSGCKINFLTTSFTYTGKRAYQIDTQNSCGKEPFISGNTLFIRAASDTDWIVNLDSVIPPTRTTTPVEFSGKGSRVLVPVLLDFNGGARIVSAGEGFIAVKLIGINTDFVGTIFESEIDLSRGASFFQTDGTAEYLVSIITQENREWTVEFLAR